jgi:phage-related protein
VIYVLHAFQKKATKGIKTPKRDMDLISQRLEAARKHFGERQN